jgi:hypothetical protein
MSKSEALNLILKNYPTSNGFIREVDVDVTDCDITVYNPDGSKNFFDLVTGRFIGHKDY